MPQNVGSLMQAQKAPQRFPVKLGMTFFFLLIQPPLQVWIDQSALLKHSGLSGLGCFDLIMTGNDNNKQL